MQPGTTVTAAGWVRLRAHPGQSAAEYHALGPSLYGGTAGVGLFLAQIANATGDRSFRRTAVGALRHATAPTRQSPVSRRGRISRGLCRSRLGGRPCGADCCEDEELHARAVALSTQPDVPSGPDRCPDLITGMAGSALGLLALADELGDPRLVEQAVATGEILIGRATVTSHGWSWAIPDQALSRAPVRHLPRRSRNRVGAARVIRSDRR